MAAIRIANELKNELARFHLKIVILDDGQESEQLADDEHLEFNRLLPLELKDEQMKTATDFDWNSDEQYESKGRQIVHLYRCKEEGGNINIESVKDGPLTRSDLDSNDTFIVDNGANLEIWVWVGKDATTKERSSGLKYAMELIKKNGYPTKTEVTKVIENGETVEFKSLFKQWSALSTFAVEHEKHARLFNVLRNGKFAQVVQYEKHDLEEDNAMILGKHERIQN